jgi:ribose/xylose/arabinose/galactoside ABC-type transport system permease subunit
MTTVSRILHRLRPVLSVQLAVLLLVLLGNWVLFPGFFDLSVRDGRLFGSLIDVLNRGAPVAILAVGMTLVIATRGVDLSVGAVMAVAGAIAATLVVAGYPAWVAVPLALLAGVACGAWNGFLIAVLDMQPIVATLVLMVAGRGVAQLITEGSIVTFDDPWLVFLGNGTVLGLPMAPVLLVVLAVVTILVVRRTALGLFIEAVGVNPSAARFAGLRSKLVILIVYSFAGFCAGLAGLLAAADIQGADANNAGLWLELDAILAVVIGGTSLMGGRFSIVRSIIGAMIIQATNTGILVSGLPPEFNLIVKAAVILVILVLQSPQSAGLLRRTRGARP